MPDKFKAVSFTVLGMDRYFVIPSDRDIFELVDPNSRSIGDDVLCQASNWPHAVRIAFALNYYALRHDHDADKARITNEGSKPCSGDRIDLRHHDRRIDRRARDGGLRDVEASAVTDYVTRYVRACRMAANETVRLYTFGGVSIERLTAMVRDVGRLEMTVSGLTDAERAELNRQLQGKVALRSIFADLMWLRTRNAELKALLLSFSATASADGQVPAASNCDATTSEPIALHMPPRDD